MATGLRALAAALGWFAVVLQYGIFLAEEGRLDPATRTLIFLSFFTILTNILSAAAMTASIVARGSFLDRAGTRTAIATYLIVVALTYHLLLRHLWNPRGWEWVTDLILHYVAPALFVLDWLLFVPKRALPWRTAVIALAYPVLYFGWTLWHGSWSGFYPYPFMDVAELGLRMVLRNAGGLALAFFVLCLALVGIGRVLARMAGPRSSEA